MKVEDFRYLKLSGAQEETPDNELQRKRRSVIWIRWLLVVATAFLIHTTGEDPFGMNRYMIAGFVLSNVVVTLLPHRVFIDPIFYYIIVPADTLFVAAGIYLGGAATTFFYLTFCLVVLIASLGRKLSYSLLGALAVLMVYMYGAGMAGLEVPVVQIPFLMAVAVFLGRLNEKEMVDPGALQELLRDKQELERTQIRLRESEGKFRGLAETLANGIFIIRDWRILYANPAAESITGFSREELMSQSFLDFVDPEFQEVLKKQGFDRKAPSPSGDGERYEVKIVTRDRVEKWLDVSFGAIEFDGETARIGAVTDITQRKQMESKLAHSATHDSLTGLPNRNFALDSLKKMIAEIQQGKEELFAVLFVDLDRFKLVNDTLGHDVGDRLLKAVAGRIRNCIRPTDAATRIGGDEFLIILRKVHAIDAAMRVAERIHQQMMAPFQVGGHEVFTSASIGIALSDQANSDPEELIRNADSAMYRAKADSHQKPHSAYHTATHSSAIRSIRIETDLRKAVERKEFVVHYQPVVELAGGQIKGFEALVRWQHPEKGVIPPADFIPLAEETGLIIPIGWWVAREACRQVAQWLDLYPQQNDLFININVSQRQFLQPDMVDIFDEILRDANLPAEHVHLEFTENILMASEESTAVKLLLLKAQGARLIIDDFGTGYTLLSHLHKFPTDILKIDRSFLRALGPNGENGQLVELIFNIANTMQAELVAEGIETPQQYEYLKKLGCRFGQGFLFSRPVTADVAGSLLDKQVRHGRSPFDFVEADPKSGSDVVRFKSRGSAS